MFFQKDTIFLSIQKRLKDGQKAKSFNFWQADSKRPNWVLSF